MKEEVKLFLFFYLFIPLLLSNLVVLSRIVQGLNFKKNL